MCQTHTINCCLVSSKAIQLDHHHTKFLSD